MHSDVLAGLLEELGIARAVVCGGSAGARLSLVTAIRHPEATAGLGLWWVSGGVYAMFFLGMLYHAASIDAVWNDGMAGGHRRARVAGRHQPQSGQPPTVSRSGSAGVPTDVSPLDGGIVPVDQLAAGIAEADARRLDVPILIFRNGVSDMNHTRTTSDRLAELVPKGAGRRPSLAGQRMDRSPGWGRQRLYQLAAVGPATP